MMNSPRAKYQKIGKELHEELVRNTSCQSAPQSTQETENKFSRLPDKIIRSLRTSRQKMKRMEQFSDYAYTSLDGQSDIKQERNISNNTVKNLQSKPTPAEDSFSLSGALMSFSYSFFPFG